MERASFEAELLNLVQGQGLAAEAERIACVGTWWRNMETDEIGWSDGVFCIFGVSRDNFKPSFETFSSMVHPADRPKIKNRIERTVAKGEPLDLEYRLQRPSGEIRYVHSRAQFVAVEPAGTKFLVGAVHDITEKKNLGERWLAARDTARELSTPITSIMLCLDVALKIQKTGRPVEGEEILRALTMAKLNADKLAKLVRSLKKAD